MSLNNGKCPSCGGALLLDASKEKVLCRYCGHEVIIPEAVQKCVVDGIVDFDTKLLSAQRAIEIQEDFDKAEKYYREALDLRPDDYRALWGIFLCAIASIKWANNLKGYVQFPGDIPININNAIKYYGNSAYANAPDDIKPFYYREIQRIKDSFLSSKEEPPRKKGCYIATAIYGSYNCPEVWILRRYRDKELDSNFFGKVFIKIYYAISPLIIKMFGRTKGFNRFWKTRLDKKVMRLKNKGYADTPYDDK